MLIARFDIDDGLNTIFQGFPEYMELLVRIIDTGCRSLGIPFKIEGRQLITDKWDENYGRKVS